ncbi:lysophospholipid acyltransferase family protein [Limimaricola pyoseonensis]|uniref:DUF374 domain-containing protein n=1 Tax=Limimaricola pyoseonensis TaxID=521013 RepID=A0A1G7LEB8_9RHOB|nr:hypothetical protein [Limimaricola pyoseonensis]SDF47664.1 hypothetical protein SAMN04488567_0456 [Limimaricola pyoseonensis]
MSLRKRLARSPALIGTMGGLAHGYLGHCQRRTRWERRGDADLRAALAEGPVLLILRHSRLMLGPFHWPRDTADLSSLHDTSPIARIAGDTHRRSGLTPVAMSPRLSNLAMSRLVMDRLRAGASIGITADGPLGPAGRVNDPPIDWARSIGRPVFFYAYSVERQARAKSWDRLLLPRPGGRGAVVFRRWEGTVPRRLDTQAREAARASLQAGLDAATAEADAMLGLPPGP